MNPISIPDVIWAILMTVLGGIFYSLIMMGKARQEGEGPDGYKFLRTVIWGALVGAVAYYLGLDFSSANEYLMLALNGYVVILVDQVASGIWRQYGVKIQQWLENKKSEIEPPEDEKKEEDKKEGEKKEGEEAKEPEKPKDEPKKEDAPKEAPKPAEEPKEAPK